MATINNPKLSAYDTKQPTNVRLIESLKKLAIKEAQERNVTLAHVINDALSVRYKQGGTVDVGVDTQDNLG